MAKRFRRFDLRKTLFILPNLITLSSIFCGFDSIRLSATAGTKFTDGAGNPVKLTPGRTWVHFAPVGTPVTAG